MIRGTIERQISGSPSFVDLHPDCQSIFSCGELCHSIQSWNKSDPSRIGVGFYDDFNCMLNKGTYKAIILIDTINQDQDDLINKACPKQTSCFRPSYPSKKL